MTFSDIDAPTLGGLTIQVGNFIRTQDVFAFNAPQVIAGQFDEFSGSFTFNGIAPIADYETLLDSITYDNFSNQPNALSKTFTITVNDGSPDDNFATATQMLQMFATNDKPLLDDDVALPPLLEGAAAPMGQKISRLFRSSFSDPDQGGFLRGIALINVPINPAQGVWQYSIDNGDTWFDIPGDSAPDSALTLAAATRIRFVPAAGFSGEPVGLTAYALDNTYVAGFSDENSFVYIDTTISEGTESLSADAVNVGITIFPVDTGGNTAPTFDEIPASKNVEEATLVEFNVSANDAEGQTLTFSLDVAPENATLNPDTGEFSWLTTEADGPNTFAFNIEVSDGFATTTRTVTIIVREVNASPLLAGVPQSVPTVRGNAVTFSATASDTDVLNGEANALTFSLVNAPAGASIDPESGAFAWTPGETIPAGVYPITVWVADDGTPSKRANSLITITVADAEIVGSDLMIGGTGANDKISVNPTKTGGLLVKNGKKVLGTFTLVGSNGRVIVHGLGGDDTNKVATKVIANAMLFGGAGNDNLTGGGGVNLLVGGDGNDKLTGGKVRDVLLGGTGADKLSGGLGDDLLIAGPTLFDNDLLSLTGIVSQWSAPTNYAARVILLSGPDYFVPGTVTDDREKDVLGGAAGEDWFFASELDVVKAKPGEAITTV